MPKTISYPAAAAAPSDLDAERRTEARYITQDPAEFEILPGPSQPIRGTIVDVSRSGLRVTLPQRIGRGEQVRVKLLDNVILGEVRYCRALSGAFQAGIQIRNLVRPAGSASRHIADDPLSLYALGRGLSAPVVILLREHLARCEACRTRLVEKEALVNRPRAQAARLK